MRSHRRRCITTVVMSVAASLASGGGVAAAEPASKFTLSSCSTSSGYTYCSTSESLTKTGTNPSGNATNFTHGRTISTVTGPDGYFTTYESRYSFRWSYIDGVLHGQMSTGNTSYTIPGFNCTAKYITQYVNGEVRVTQDKSECVPTT